MIESLRGSAEELDLRTVIAQGPSQNKDGLECHGKGRDKDIFWEKGWGNIGFGPTFFVLLTTQEKQRNILQSSEFGELVWSLCWCTDVFRIGCTGAFYVSRPQNYENKKNHSNEILPCRPARWKAC